MTPSDGWVMKPTPQCPHARHPIAFAIQVPAQTADPQHRLADRQFRWLHPFPKATYQHLDLVFAQDLQRRGLGGLPPRSRNNTIRAATAASTLTAFSSLSQVSKRRSSTLQPLLSTKWTSSIGHRQVYFRTTSSASSAVAAGSSVQSSQCAAWVPAGGAGSHTSTRFQVVGQACGYFCNDLTGS